MPGDGDIPVLIVDDDEALCEMLGEYLGDSGIAADYVHTGGDVFPALASGQYRLIILDVMLPDGSGFDVLRRLRSSSGVAVLMLTAKGDDTDRIVGLELGADDYLPKPFNPRELLARCRAILRRSGAGRKAASGMIRAGDIEIDRARQSATFAGADLQLTGAEFRILECLAGAGGEVVSRDQLSEQALGRPYQPLDRSVDTHASNIRRKLAAAGADGYEIRTVRGRGYILVAGP